MAFALGTSSTALAGVRVQCAANGVQQTPRAVPVCSANKQERVVMETATTAAASRRRALLAGVAALGFAMKETLSPDSAFAGGDMTRSSAGSLGAQGCLPGVKCWDGKSVKGCPLGDEGKECRMQVGSCAF